MTSITDTPEIRLAFQVNAPGSLIPTVQLRALVEAVERMERALEPFRIIAGKWGTEVDDPNWTDDDILLFADREGHLSETPLVLTVGDFREARRAAIGMLFVNPPVGGAETIGNAAPSPNPAESAAPPQRLTEDQIKHMVSRFLGWRLPEDFRPDAGITFKPTFNEHTAHPMRHTPVGTNLLDAGQAEAMVRYMLEGLPDAPAVARAPASQAPVGDGSAHTITSAEVARLVEEANRAADEKWGEAHPHGTLLPPYQEQRLKREAELFHLLAQALESLALSEGRMRETLATLIEKWESDAWVTDQDEMARIARQALQGGKG